MSPQPNIKRKPSAPRRISRRTFLRRAGATGLLAAIPGGLSATYWLSIEHSELKLKNWTADGFKVAFISDLHVDSEADVTLTQGAIQEAISFKPDVILFGGDYLTGNPTPKLGLLARALQPLAAATSPIIGITGNHDIGPGKLPTIQRILKDCRVDLIINDEVMVGKVRIICLDDGFGKPDYEKFSVDSLNSPTIVAMHEPDMVVKAPQWAHLQLSGHSHGGQICLPGGIPLFQPDLAQLYNRGFYPDARIPLYVTRGIGTRRLPFRYYCRPELSLLTLRSA